MNNIDTNLIILLVILSILSFTRTIIYVLFDMNLVALDKQLGFNFEPALNNILLIFAILRLLLATIILYKRTYQFDLITISLIYLIFTSFLRFYYEYLYLYKPRSKELYYIDKYQDVNAILIFTASAYIMYYIFFR
jgi:hypothetical protein